LDELDYCMREIDSETVDANVVTLTDPAAKDSPTGTFEVFASKYAPTVQGADASSQLNGIIHTNQYHIVCTNNDASGVEVFEVRGNLPRSYSRAHENWENAGLAGTLLMISSEGNTLLPNGGFEVDGATEGFANWVIDVGAWNTELEKETTQIYRGSQSLKINLTATNARMTYTFPAGFLEPYTKYLISFKVKTHGVPTGGSQLKVGFIGTAGLFYQTPTDIPTDFSANWDIIAHFFNTGPNPDAIVAFSIDATAGVAGGVYIDEVCFTKVDIFRGLGICVVSGDVDPYLNDNWLIQVSNSKLAKFQTFFGRYYDFLLNADSAGGETIADALAG